MKPYPIKFQPILKEKIWGGQKLKTLLNKNTTGHSVGESWEISDVDDNISVVINGIYKGLDLKTLLHQFGEQLVGKKAYSDYGNKFPLLIKFLDAKTDLSVQVHPDDDMAERHHGSFGKTEMWYIMDSDDDASIILDFKPKDLNLKVLENINAENVEDIFNRVAVKKDEHFFIPAGKMHAIGSGVLAAEIQQTSDITYRVYDWDRTDDQGHKRELHTQLAMEAARIYDSTEESIQHSDRDSNVNLVNCKYFKTNVLKVNHIMRKDYRDLDSFVIYMCVEGSAEIYVDNFKEHIALGETVLLPATSKFVYINSQECKLLEVHV